ncbi:MULTISPECIES: ABC transporter permease [unclassified Meiothermus]|uniref:ABC transporter permease n=1 Tax=unclassified Meiothermus TaxID=370471 RepID=UPI000D7CB515|nr:MULTISPECIES: ABC transporter permease [unclassified Meiothermus]PZA07066.1 ABC transporter permease [Meiothermus sp. Pnk-1]RYM40058.1 ABC transporter permease [Meiothermus sp. PNK-Is4]
MRFVWFLALRHLRYRRTQSLATLLGVAVGVMVLTTALSLTNGFTQGLIEATLRGVPHIFLQALDPRNAPPPQPDLEVVAQTPYLVTKALLTRRATLGQQAGIDVATVWGLGAGAQRVYPRLDLSGLKPGSIILGVELARQLGAFPGDRIFLLSVSQERLSLEVAGTFRTGNALLDAGNAFATLEDVRRLTDQPQGLSGYQVLLRDPEQAPRVAQRLSGTHYFAQTWQSLNRTLIEQLALQKRVIGIVVFLIVAVAALGMANVLVLAVVEKTPDIALLRVMGAGGLQVAGVFALEGLILGAAGVALGNLLGYGLSTYFALNPVRIPGELYFISGLPAQLRLGDFVWVSLMSLGVVLLASLLPLWRALGVKPGEVLR